MFNTTEQFSDFNKASIESAVRVAQLGLDSTEKLVQLNLDVAKTLLEEGVKNAKAISGATDINDLLALRASLAETSVEGALNYSRNVYDVAFAAQAELSKLFQEGFVTVNKNVANVVERAAKSAPAGSDFAVNAVKSTIAATTAAIDSISKVGKQVVDMADASVKAATSATASAVKTASKKAA